MKKITLTILLFATLLLNACSGVAPATQPAAPVDNAPAEQPAAVPPAATQESVQTESGPLNTDYENAVSVAMQLLLGTIKLEGTTNAVTKEQAAALTPLWTNFKSLSESMRPAQGEPAQQGQPNATPQPVDNGLQTNLDEIVKQIQSTMTAEQVQAISNMRITQEMSRTIMDEQGITMGGPQQGNEGMPGGGGAGQPPVGGLGGGQQPGGGQMGNPPAGGMQPNGMGFVPSELIDALIKLLGQK